MGIINQPWKNALGQRIIEHITGRDNYYGWKLCILVAYVRRSGVSRIREAIEYFRGHGGVVIAIAGVDQNNTTIQGIKSLFDIADELYVFHSEASHQTFHPKVYIINKGGTDATVFVGSSNLTAGGLFTNYEVMTETDYNLGDENNNLEYNEILAAIDPYKNVESDCCLRVTAGIISEMNRLGYLANEEIVLGARRSAAGRAETEEGEALERLFGTEYFRPPPVTIIERTVGEITESFPEHITLMGGFWKKLSNNDVSTSSSPGQIITPIKYISYFPNLSARQVMRSGAQQAEVFFNVLYTNKEGTQRRINRVRAIHYIPAPQHPRPNQELRFTFRNQTILHGLQRGDILLFQRTDNPDIWFDIHHYESGVDQGGEVSFRIGRWGIINND